MATKRQKIGGWIAQRSGLEFENRFQASCELQGLWVERIPDGCRYTGKGLQRVPVPFDFIVGLQGRTINIDLKSRNADRVTFADFKNPSSKYQFARMLRAHKKAGIRGGFLIYLKQTHKIWWLNVTTLESLLISGINTGTVPEEMMVCIGEIYRMDIRSLFNPNS